MRFQNESLSVFEASNKIKLKIDLLNQISMKHFVYGVFE
jgi:hypothetical protein